MIDISKTVEPKSDQLNADDLDAGPREIIITKVTGDADPQQPISVHFEGDNGRPYKPCKSMRRVLMAAWGKNGEAYIGRSLTLYRDPKVKFGGIEVGGIRVSHMSDIDQPEMTVLLTKSKAVRRPYTVKRLETAPSDPEAAIAAMVRARDVATEGKVAFLKWYNTAEGRAMREFFNGNEADMAELAAICAEADAEAEKEQD